MELKTPYKCPYCDEIWFVVTSEVIGSEVIKCGDGKRGCYKDYVVDWYARLDVKTRRIEGEREEA